MDLSGKNVVYLGGFGGIGQKCIHEFLNKSLKALVIFDLIKSDELMSKWRNEFAKTEIIYKKVDITKKTDIEEAYKDVAKKIGPFDVVVNGSGLMNDQLIEKTIEINLLGVIHSSLTALDYMDTTKGGHGGLIVNISSVAGLEPTSMFAVYSAAKTGLTTFTRAMANPIYYKRTGVGFITICPGFTETALLEAPAEKALFSFPTPMAAAFAKVKRQSAEVCAQNLVKVVESAKNGAVWKLEYGEMSEVEFPVLWRPIFE